MVVLGTWISSERDNPIYVMVSLILVSASVFICMKLNMNTCTIEQPITTTLYAGYNDSEINGSFFLGTGHIDEQEMVYYWIDENGVKSKHDQPMSMSVFIEDGKNIMVEKYEICPNNLQWLFIDPGLYQIEFHVPKNSIVQMYKYQ
jgi:hypothetical protein